jgi:phage host-nuclease inhibitor protein Gam
MEKIKVKTLRGYFDLTAPLIRELLKNKEQGMKALVRMDPQLSSMMALLDMLKTASGNSEEIKKLEERINEKLGPVLDLYINQANELMNTADSAIKELEEQCEKENWT